MQDLGVGIDHLRAAAERLRPHLNRTPLLRTAVLDEHCQGQVFLKPECLQLTGSFKIRGALNRLLQLSDAEKAAGVVAYSSGNHAQGVALAAKIAGVHATIVMPADAPAVKVARTKRSGAEVVPYDRYTESREEIGQALAAKRGCVLVPPFDDPHVIAGQGTAGLEVAADLARLGQGLDQLLVCCSGGGLAAGMGVAMAAEMPGAQLYTVEPDGFDDTQRSLMAGQPLSNPPGGGSICDALLVERPGDITLPILCGLSAKGVTVSDEEVLVAMKFAFDELRVVVEPGGAVALAAILFGHVPTKGKTTVATLSGGNVDLALFNDAMNAPTMGRSA